MLHIRLTRIGKKKQPEYRLIVCEKARDPWGRAKEIVGHYNPRSTPATVTLKQDRIQYWIQNGAQCSDTVWNLLVDQGVVKGEKRKSIKISKKRKEALEKKKPKAEAPKEEAPKAEAPKEESAPAEAPKEEAAPEAPVEAPAEALVEEAKPEEKPEDPPSPEATENTEKKPE